MKFDVKRDPSQSEKVNAQPVQKWVPRVFFSFFRVGGKKLNSAAPAAAFRHLRSLASVFVIFWDGEICLVGGKKDQHVLVGEFSPTSGGKKNPAWEPILRKFSIFVKIWFFLSIHFHRYIFYKLQLISFLGKTMEKVLSSRGFGCKNSISPSRVDFFYHTKNRQNFTSTWDLRKIHNFYFFESINF